MQQLKRTLGWLLTGCGIVFALFPGSIFLLIGGLLLLSSEYELARRYLKKCQNAMSDSARRIDRFLLLRRLK